MVTYELVQALLQEIDTLSKRGVVPVTVDNIKHLVEGGNIMEYMVTMKNQGLISGDLVTMVDSGTPHRMTNIRLTYAGIRALRQ
jgi:hypothetical protein